MRDHALRKQAVGEMHLRRWPELRVPCMIVQWVLIVDDSERDEELSAIEERAQNGETAESPAYRAGNLVNGIRFVWEKHSEGTSLTLFVHDVGPDVFLEPQSNADVKGALEWAQSMPGEIVRSTRIWVAENDEQIDAILPNLNLVRGELVSCNLGRKIRMWSDFRIKDDGFGRLLVATNGAEPVEVTRQVQRVQELGNYRNRALLGLPVARDCWPKLDEAEGKLRDLAARIEDPDENDDTLTDTLSKLSLELAAIETSISFRMDATKAYAQLVKDRLVQVDSRHIPGFASLTDFTQRRFFPAMNTCEATTARVRQLALRAAQLASLLRARIDARIENQNAQLLGSMEKSTRMQVRLQQLVEGFSVVALSYYLIGLVGYLIDGLPLARYQLSKEWVLAVLVIPVVASIWIGMRILKHRLFRGDP
ncbi:hypothetical protein BPTFM16_01644 [Altererythrobacter insulae]|nr:hypothetical protein BPTFM16_01644 [Altererythrobacter insulae]